MATFFNQATLSYNGTVTNSNVVSGELVDLISVTKTAIPGTYRPGDTVTYIVSITNAGSVPYTGLTVTDDLGEYTFGETGQVVPLTYEAGSMRYYADGVLQSDPTVQGGPPLTVTGLTVPAEGSAMLVYLTTVNEFAPPEAGGSVVNTVTVSGGTLSAPLTASETITAATGAYLSISKSVSPTTVVGSGPLTYSFTIQNLGSDGATADDNVSLQDTFDPILTIQSVTYNGTALTVGTDYTYDEATGAFATVPGQLTVPAADYQQDETGRWAVLPGIGVLTVTGTV